MEPKTTGKRIVSKGDYVRLIGTKIGAGIVVCLIVFLALVSLPVYRDMFHSGISWVFMGCWALYGYTYVYRYTMKKIKYALRYVYRYTMKKIKYALRKEDVVPITRTGMFDEKRSGPQVGGVGGAGMDFNLQIKGAVSAGRFTIIWGTLLDGSMQQPNYISLPAKDGSRLITTMLDLGVGDKMHTGPGPVTGRCEFVSMRTWHPVIDPQKIQLMGIATRSDVAPYMRKKPNGKTPEQ